MPKAALYDSGTSLAYWLMAPPRVRSRQTKAQDMTPPNVIPVDEFTTPSPVTVTPSTPLSDVVRLMRENGFFHLPVVDGDHPVGIISERDVRGVATSDRPLSLITVGEVMSTPVYSVEVGTALETVALGMARRHVGSALVTQNGSIAGIFTGTDALNALVEVLRGEPLSVEVPGSTFGEPEEDPAYGLNA